MDSEIHKSVSLTLYHFRKGTKEKASYYAAQVDLYCTKCNSERLLLLLLVVVVLLSVLLLYWCILRMQHNNLCCCIFPHAAFDRIILFKDSSSAGQLLSQ